MNTMPFRLALALPISLCLALFLRVSSSQEGEGRTEITFDTKRLSKMFYAEGAAFGDLNHDGVMDVVAGPYWYAGPEFEASHEIYAPEPVDVKAYSNNFFCFVEDFNRDGWGDVLVYGFPGKEAFWFENPRDTEKLWQKHIVFDMVDNESPHWIDLDGNGKKEIVCSRGGVFGYAAPDWNEPTKPWVFHPISDKATGGQFTHGLGVGDVNGDGRADLLEKNGWWEQPASLEGNPKWTFHPVLFSEPGGAQMYAYDVDGDGDNDIVTSLAAHAYGFAWFEQTGTREGEIAFEKHLIMGEEPEQNPYGIAFSQTHAVAMADMDGDGVKDIITGKRWYAHGGKDAGGLEPPVLYWFKTVRSGEAGKVDFLPYFVDDSSGVGTEVKTGDIDGDGLEDILVGNKKGTFVHLQRRVPIDHEGYRSIFDGESLKGWLGDGDYWRAENGAIVGEWKEGAQPKANTFLFWNAEPLADFDLRLQYRISGADNANSGIQFRSVNEGAFHAKGYQADLEGGPTWLGRIYDEHGRALLAERGRRVLIDEDGKRAEATFAEPAELMEHVRKGDWNDYQITACGENIEVRVNGKVMSQLVDRQKDERDLYGLLAFQLHQMAPVKVEYRNVRVKRLFGNEMAIPVADLEEKLAGAPAAEETEYAGYSAEEAVKRMEVPEGFEVELVAKEPDLLQPIAFTFDARGRLWVVEGMTYPQRAPEGEGKDRILVFEDTDHDGSFETRKVFIDQLNLVSGIEVGFGGVWVGAAPYFMFIPDRDGDDKPDGEPEILLDGWGFHDTHETLNSFIWGPDGWLYGCHGVFTHSKVGKPGTPDKERIPFNCAYWRYHPVRHEFEIFAHGTSNPWGIDFNDYGQAFATACVIPHFWHVIQGGYYHRQSNPLGHHNPYVYENIQTIADHVHYIGNTPHAGNDVSDAAGGGHAHCGLTVYLGGQFPERYRDQPIFFNLHGHRMNQDVLERQGSGYVAKHGPDFLKTNDPWFMGVAVKYGPEGSLFFIDWYDDQTCHRTLPEIWDRGNGRMYEVSYGGAGKGVAVDLDKADDLELVRRQDSDNDWYVRTARRLLQERKARGDLSDDVVAPLMAKLQSDAPTPERLRALWALHAIDALPETTLDRLLDDPDEYLRAWAIQLGLERKANVTSSQAARLTELAKGEEAALVRLYLASALQRLPEGTEWDLAKALVDHAGDADDHNLPQMIWYGVEARVVEAPERALGLARASNIPLVRELIVRRLCADDEGLFRVLEHLASDEAPREASIVRDYLAQVREGMKGREVAEAPEAWNRAYTVLSARSEPEIASIVEELAVIFGDRRIFPQLRETLANRRADLDKRKRALEILANAEDPDLPLVLLPLLSDSEIVLPSLQALGAYDAPEIPASIVEAYPSFSAETKRAALGTLAMRVDGAKALLAAMRSGRIPPGDLPSFIARQMRNLGEPEITKVLEELWGSVGGGSEETKEQMKLYQELLTPEFLAKANLPHGRYLYSQTCQSCHTLFGEGLDIGPDLTGSNRANVDYILENVVDPNALVGKDYQLQIVTLKDGRVLSGMIREETERGFEVQLLENKEFVAANDVAKRDVLPVSMMPPGLFATLSDVQVRDLVAYLGSPSQVPMGAPPAEIDPETGKVPGALEGESMQILAKKGATSNQPMGSFPLGQWSGNSQLWWTGAQPGDRLTLALPVPEKGSYAIQVSLTKAIDYGMIQFWLGDEKLGEPVDCFEKDGVVKSGVLTLGERELDQGDHRLTLEITGAHPEAIKAYMAGVDFVKLKKLD